MSKNTPNNVLKSGLQSHFGRTYKAPYYSQNIFLSAVPPALEMVVLLLLLMTVASNSQTKTLNMPLILVPYQIWMGHTCREGVPEAEILSMPVGLTCPPLFSAVSLLLWNGRNLPWV